MLISIGHFDPVSVFTIVIAGLTVSALSHHSHAHHHHVRNRWEYLKLGRALKRLEKRGKFYCPKHPHRYRKDPPSPKESPESSFVASDESSLSIKALVAESTTKPIERPRCMAKRHLKEIWHAYRENEARACPAHCAGAKGLRIDLQSHHHHAKSMMELNPQPGFKSNAATVAATYTHPFVARD